MTASSLIRKDYPDFTAYLTVELPRETLESILSAKGETLKSSKKYETRRVGNYVLKTSLCANFWQHFRYKYFRTSPIKLWQRYQRFLQIGVLCPKLIGIIDWKHSSPYGLRTMITEYVANAQNVEEYVRMLVRSEASSETVTVFFRELQTPLQKLFDSRVYHSDLSGKNILTKDGKQFVFIDLEAVRIDVSYTPRRRMKNLVQLYDSFCDIVDEKSLDLFIRDLLPESHLMDQWLKQIKKRQRQRRVSHLKKHPAS